MTNRALLLAAGLSLLAGCGEGSGLSTAVSGRGASLQIINASAATGTASVTAGGNTLRSALDFRSAACVSLPEGVHALTFASGGTPIAATDSMLLDVGQPLTVVFFDDADAGSDVVVQPLTFTTPAAGSVAIRFINGSALTGDIFVTTPTGTVVGTPNIAALANGEVSSFRTFAAANTRIRFFSTGETETPFADITLGALPANRATTVVFTDSVPAGGAVAFQVNGCQ